MLVREASEPVFCMDAHVNNKQILIAITVDCMVEEGNWVWDYVIFQKASRQIELKITLSLSQ